MSNSGRSTHNSQLTTHNSIGVVVLGAGTIGRALLGQIAARHAGLSETLGVGLRVLTVATSRLWTLPERGPLTQRDLAALADDGIGAVENRPHAEAELRAYL